MKNRKLKQNSSVNNCTKPRVHHTLKSNFRYVCIRKTSQCLMKCCPFLLKESMMKNMLARQLVQSINTPVFPGLPQNLPMYASAPVPSISSLHLSLSAREGPSATPIASGETGSGYVQHLQSMMESIRFIV